MIIIQSCHFIIFVCRNTETSTRTHRSNQPEIISFPAPVVQFGSFTSTIFFYESLFLSFARPRPKHKKWKQFFLIRFVSDYDLIVWRLLWKFWCVSPIYIHSIYILRKATLWRNFLRNSLTNLWVKPQLTDIKEKNVIHRFISKQNVERHTNRFEARATERCANMRAFS